MLRWVEGTPFARPLEPESRESFPLLKIAGAAVVLIAGALAALWQVRGIGSQLTAPEKYLRTHEWYVNGESGNLRLWQDKNHNGISERNELTILAALNVKAFELDFRESKRVDQYGNEFRYKAKVKDTREGNVGKWAWDIFLAH